MLCKCISTALPDKPTLTVKGRKSIRTLTCSGDVGRPPQSFEWYRYRLGDTNFAPYLGNGITQDAPIEDDSRCQFTRQSVLTYNLEPGDDDLKFRCVIKSNLTGTDLTFSTEINVSSGRPMANNVNNCTHSLSAETRDYQL